MDRLYSSKCRPPGEMSASLSPLLAIKEKYGHRNLDVLNNLRRIKYFIGVIAIIVRLKATNYLFCKLTGT